jgi:hypothetical protein
LFDSIKLKIIIRLNVWFDEKSHGIKLLNFSSGLLQNDPFDVVSDISSHVLFFIHFTGNSNFVLVSTWSSTSMSIFVSTRLPRLSTENTLTYDWPTKMNPISHVSYIPRWAAKTIELVGVDASDVSSGWQTRSQKQHVSVALITLVLETSDHVSYSDVEERTEWEQAMQMDIDSLSKNHTWDLVPQLQGKNIMECWWV